MFQALADRWMIIEEKLEDRRGFELGKVLVCQTGHCAFEGASVACHLQGILVGLVLDEPTIGIADGHDDEAKHAREQEEEGQGCRVGQGQICVLRLDKPMQYQVGDVEATEGQHCLADDQLPDVGMDMMSQFVCQYYFDLVSCVAVQHRVTYYNAARIA